MRKCIATVIALLGRHIEWQKHECISYLQSLDEESNRRYSQKLTGMLEGIEDPYGFNKGDSVKHDERLWPCVEYPGCQYTELSSDYILLAAIPKIN